MRASTPPDARRTTALTDRLWTFALARSAQLPPHDFTCAHVDDPTADLLVYSTISSTVCVLLVCERAYIIYSSS